MVDYSQSLNKCSATACAKIQTVLSCLFELPTCVLENWILLSVGICWHVSKYSQENNEIYNCRWKLHESAKNVKCKTLHYYGE